MGCIQAKPQRDSTGSEEISAFRGSLCSRCLAICWIPDDPGPQKDQKKFQDWHLDHHKTFGELEISCGTGCPLCRTFFLLLTYDGIELERDYPLRWKLSCDNDTWSLAFTSDMFLWGEPRWFMDDASDIKPSQSITTVKSLAPMTLKDDLNAILNGSINPWLDACTHSGAHGNCPSMPAHESDFYCLPTRLIDVGSEAEPAIRLVNTADLSEKKKRSPYLILSYRWGQGNDPARTTSQNLEERKVAIKCQNLPKTIQDAIEITRLMKIPYLWVDAICIVQSDRNGDRQQQDDFARVDWERESKHMAEYYSNSLCCIAASNAKDSSEGILVERRVTKYPFKEWCNPVNKYFPSPHAIRGRFKSSLLERGWCLQEWILSPRMLHWTANGLVWECPHGLFWEGQPGFRGEPPEQFHDGSRLTNDCFLNHATLPNNQSIREMLRQDEEEALGSSWTRLIGQYVMMHLSFSSDRIAAIQGVASYLSKRHGVDFFAGVFLSPCAAEHLSWTPIHPQESPGTDENFPTWSWASSEGELRFEFTEDPPGTCASLMEDFEVFPAAKDQTSLSHMTNKEIRFAAPLIRFNILEPEYGDLANKDSEYSFSRSIKVLIGPGSPVWQGRCCYMLFDSLRTSLSLMNRVHLLVLSHAQRSRPTYHGLVVCMVEKNDEERNLHDRDSYQRMGVFYVEQPKEYLERLVDVKAWSTSVSLV